MDDYINIYTNVYFKLIEIGKELSLHSFSEKNDKVELYGLVSLNLCKQQTKSIYILLEHKLHPSVLILIRNVFETFFNYQWILRGETKSEKIERVNQLEGKAFNDIEKELNVMKENSSSSNPIWKPEMYEDKEKFLEFLKTHYPELTYKDKTEIKFKKPKESSLESRMSYIERIKFYSLYRFTCAFVHPTPILRDLLLLREGSEKNPIQLLKPHLKEALDYCLFLIYGIAFNLSKVLEERKEFNKEKVDKILAEIFSIISNSSASKLLEYAI
ncbi:MAG: hypothetical protein A2V93_06385 [Ignavibacteria bacterium RBG_16_34_14]|nr:MAG: hypothetical protein A2V93_06385 [Ignavibacteria bacterium RBG_16_34_14]